MHQVEAWPVVTAATYFPVRPDQSTVMPDDCHCIELQLATELKQAKRLWDEARAELCQTTAKISVDGPDKIWALQNASLRERSTAADYAAALKRFSGFIMDGHVPCDDRVLEDPTYVTKRPDYTTR